MDFPCQLYARVKLGDGVPRRPVYDSGLSGSGCFWGGFSIGFGVVFVAIVIFLWFITY